MSLILRSTKGAILTSTEVDNNFTYLASTKQAALIAGTNIKTINGNSLLGAGDLPVGSVNWSGQAIRTSNFNSVAGSWQEIEITGAGNIIGTLPVSPADNEEHSFVCRPTATDPGGRFRLGLNGKVINGRTDAATETRSTDFPLPTIAENFAYLGGSISMSGGNMSIGDNLRINNLYNPPGSITWTLPSVAANSSELTVSPFVEPGLRGANITLNGTLVYQTPNSGANRWDTVAIPLTQSLNTVVMSSYVGAYNYGCDIRDITLTGILISAPAAWTDVVPWQLNSGGRLAVRWNAEFQTWFVLEYYKGIYA